ncbi:UPF0323 family lipoprotein [Aliarcobacter butzleri]|uniref:UPF0323 family lipoprotein n=1 Tax=Aliarcobacter butzleri TaxID=28197 RepID=A0AAW7PPW5_9BACT|nr:UPF0323 family lipoprotein [Aliarcobacter butzleri]MDN5063406.1 UPF0323 family lipoprotein [Aliarcobacter butzleri]MDN5065798.1 UPF0323 family lipoprotein [Aliarcobacter butzleri]
MKKKNHIKKISDYAMVGGLGSLLVVGLVGCGDNSSNNQQQNQNNSTFTNASQQQGAFVVVEQSADGQYKIADEFPASKTTIVLRTPDGNERILSQEEIDKLVKEEEAKIDAGTSPLTNPEAQLSSGGMGLGGVLLSSIAGAMIGSWLGNKLFNNQNFQNQKTAQYKSPQTYSKSQSSFNKPAATTNSSTGAKKTGFFGGNSSSNTTNSSSFGS